MGEDGPATNFAPRKILFWMFLVLPLVAAGALVIVFLFWILAFVVDSSGREREREIGQIFEDLISLIQISKLEDDRFRYWQDEDVFPPTYNDAVKVLTEYRFSWKAIDCQTSLVLEPLDLRTHDQSWWVLTAIWPERFYVVSPMPIKGLIEFLQARSVFSESSFYRYAANSRPSTVPQLGDGSITNEQIMWFDERLDAAFPSGFTWQSIDCKGFAYIEIRG